MKTAALLQSHVSCLHTWSSHRNAPQHLSTRLATFWTWRCSHECFGFAEPVLHTQSNGESKQAADSSEAVNLNPTQKNSNHDFCAYIFIYINKQNYIYIYRPASAWMSLCSVIIYTTIATCGLTESSIDFGFAKPALRVQSKGESYFMLFYVIWPYFNLF